MLQNQRRFMFDIVDAARACMRLTKLVYARAQLTAFITHNFSANACFLYRLFQLLKNNLTVGLLYRKQSNRFYIGMTQTTSQSGDSLQTNP